MTAAMASPRCQLFQCRRQSAKGDLTRSHMNCSRCEFDSHTTQPDCAYSRSLRRRLRSEMPRRLPWQPTSVSRIYPRSTLAKVSPQRDSPLVSLFIIFFHPFLVLLRHKVLRGMFLCTG